MSTNKADKDEFPLGERMKSIRKTRGYTQENLAKILEISKDYVSRIEKGERGPSPHLKKAIEQWIADDWHNESINSGGIDSETGSQKEETGEDTPPMVRNYRELAVMDADTLGEIQTWINDMERFRPGFSSWFRLEFQNRFPEFDDWKNRLIKKRTGTGN